MSSESQPFFSSKGSSLPEDATPLYLEEKDTKRTVWLSLVEIALYKETPLFTVFRR